MSEHTYLDLMHDVRAGEMALERCKTEAQLRAAWREHAKPHPRILAARDKRLAEIRAEQGDSPVAAE